MNWRTFKSRWRSRLITISSPIPRAGKTPAGPRGSISRSRRRFPSPRLGSQWFSEGFDPPTASSKSVGPAWRAGGECFIRNEGCSEPNQPRRREKAPDGDVEDILATGEPRGEPSSERRHDPGVGGGSPSPDTLRRRSRSPRSPNVSRAHSSQSSEPSDSASNAFKRRFAATLKLPLSESTNNANFKVDESAE